MSAHWSNLAMQAATTRLEQARKLLDQSFGSGWSSERTEQVLTCSQLIATEYNSIVVQESARQSIDDLKSYLHNTF